MPPPPGLLPLAPGAALPGWCDPLLDALPAGEFFASRLWFDLTLRHAMAPEEQAVLAICGEPGAPVVLPLMRDAARGGALAALVTPYSLAWAPLRRGGTPPEALRRAGRDLAGLLRLRPPARLDALDPADPALPALLSGLRRGGITTLRYAHFGNWHQVLPDGAGWAAYLEARPPALRNTIRRKLARASRGYRFEAAAAPGPALEAGIAAYEAVRAGSWKPHEPFPDFDAALMRAAAAAGLLRLGVLRDAAGRPVAAQYWVLDRGGRRATVLKLAHLEAERAASPGTALSAMMIRALLEEDGVRELDFGRGDDPYKRLWVASRRQRWGVLLADPLHPAGLGAIARHAAGAVRRRLSAGGGPGRDGQA